MTSPTLEDLARQAVAGDPTASEILVDHLQRIFRLLDQGLLDRVLQSASVLKDGLSRLAPPAEGGLTPEFLEWARQDLKEEEITADFREVREKGGLRLEDMLPELQRIVDRP